MSEPKPAASLLFLREDELRRALEALLLAERGLAGRSDEALEQAGLGRAHARALHIIAGRGEIGVGALCAVLGVTKQSLGRVLVKLQEDGLAEERASDSDRRRKLLSLTPKGAELEARLAAPQLSALAAAFRAAGPEQVGGFRRILDQLSGRKGAA
jgi:DNA-binding MarR family transcriptional regulator